MEAGELEIKKAFEEVTTKNVRTIQDYTTETRNLVRVLEESVKQLKNMIAQRDVDLASIKQQLSLIQAKQYSGGTH